MANENLDIDSKTAEELYEWYLDDKLIINRRYQRKLVWSLEEKTALISSMTQQYPIPLLLFVSIDNKREILDGMQRLEALMSFIEQRFSLNGKYFNLDAIALTKQLKDSGKLQQKEPVLSRESSTLIARYRFAISEYSSTEDHIDEVFRRINSNGKILSKQELRSAGCVSNFSELVRKISTIIRGDTTHSDIMGLNKIHNISICNDGLDYGINIDNHFYIRNHIISRPSIRDSDDEELVANILGYIFLDDKPTSGSTSLDTFYGEGALKGLVIHVMATHDTAPWIGRMRVLRKNPEPRPGMPGARILPLKGVGKRNAAAALGLVLQPPCPCTRQLLAQAGCQALG